MINLTFCSIFALLRHLRSVLFVSQKQPDGHAQRDCDQTGGRQIGAALVEAARPIEDRRVEQRAEHRRGGVENAERTQNGADLARGYDFTNQASASDVSAY